MKDYSINFLSGGFALSAAIGIMHPLETIKTRLQTNSKNIFKNLANGFAVSSIGAAVQGGLRLSTYESTKVFLTSKYEGTNIALISALSAIVGDTVSAIVKVPREVITARLQSGIYASEIASRPTASPTMIAFNSTIRTGGIRSLYTGFFSITARDWPFMIILFTCYEHFKSISVSISVSNGVNETFIGQSTVIGGLSGGLAGFLTTPFDVIRTRVVSNTNNDSKLSIGRVAGSILKSQAPISGFFVGGVPRTVWWVCVCSMFFPLYENSKMFFRDFERTKVIDSEIFNKV